jgi:hypothetical protein
VVGHTYLLTISFRALGTKTGLVLLFSYRNCRILSIALASLVKSNSYPIWNKIDETNYLSASYFQV